MDKNHPQSFQNSVKSQVMHGLQVFKGFIIDLDMIRRIIPAEKFTLVSTILRIDFSSSFEVQERGWLIHTKISVNNFF